MGGRGASDRAREERDDAAHWRKEKGDADALSMGKCSVSSRRERIELGSSKMMSIPYSFNLGCVSMEYM